MLSAQSSLLRFVTLALVVTPSLTQMSTQCFTSGTVGDCSAFIAKFCGNIATLSIDAGDARSQCFNTPGQTFRCDLSAVNRVATTEIPSEANCQTVLSTVTAQCSMGGDGINNVPTSGFIFGIDPNNGTCGLPCGD
ncbi:hypothetical protein C8R44DRAFT_260205 [Mycena epipterygia]|nr:hypothetical protein C8R44DRAFT_260205 [Mycena epipterygia]